MEHPITPPPELVTQWTQLQAAEQAVTDHWQHIATQAAQWGADQELEAILEMVGQQSLPEEDRYLDGLTVASIRAARRPKPPSLKEQALAALEQVKADFNTGSFGDTIRRALEALPND